MKVACRNYEIFSLSYFTQQKFSTTYWLHHPDGMLWIVSKSMTHKQNSIFNQTIFFLLTIIFKKYLKISKRSSQIHETKKKNLSFFLLVIQYKLLLGNVIHTTFINSLYPVNLLNDSKSDASIQTKRWPRKYNLCNNTKNFCLHLNFFSINSLAAISNK